MNTIRHCLAAAGIALALCPPAQAAPAHPASVEQLLILQKAEQMLDALHTTLEQSIRQGMLTSIGDRQLTAQQQQVVQTLPTRVSQVLRQELSWSTLKPLLLPVYRSAFSQEEVDGLIQFYRSPVGQRFAMKQPELAYRSSLATQQLMSRVVPRVNAAMAATLQEAGLK